MRADMFKVIVERPRWGSRWAKAPKLRRTDREVKFIGHKRHVWDAADYGKSLNENLGPLRRFVRSRRGQRWDIVFGEICERLDTGSTVKMHVRQHLRDMVMFGIVRGRRGELMHEGQVIERKHLDWRRRLDGLFVDPDDGILKDIDLLIRRIGGGQ